MKLALGALVIFTGYVQKITRDEQGRALTAQVAPELAYKGRRYLAPKVFIVATPGIGDAFSTIKAETYALFLVRPDTPEGVETPIFSARSPEERILWEEPMREEQEALKKNRVRQTYWWVSAGPKEISAWQACSSHSDCAVIGGLCGTPFPLNRRFMDAASEYFKARNAQIDCAMDGPRPAPKVRCGHGFCQP